MATRYGHQTFEWLLGRGWMAAPPPAPGVMGDRHVLDPKTGQELDVYTAARLEKERTGVYPEFLPHPSG